MKTRFFAAALICFFFNMLQPVSAATPVSDPAVKVVVSAKRIWLVTDEISVKNMSVQVIDQKGKIVLEKNFSSKMTDWSLYIEQLPKGCYTVQIDGQKATCFKH
ncbi:MAG TPA: hypothetical protein PLO67_09240 [Saprospiraceae bacterium]|nr:hypothetical protein [Saprospiraceae bacterium]HPI05332.1 hypothetical protein [Saprospiraceae bacterium]